VAYDSTDDDDDSAGWELENAQRRGRAAGWAGCREERMVDGGVSIHPSIYKCPLLCASG